MPDNATDSFPCPPPPVCIKVPEVVGLGECQVLIVKKLQLEGAAIEIDHVKKTVEILPDESMVFDGKVMLDGMLHKDIIYKVKKGGGHCGPVMYCVADLPFSCLVDVPGAMEGDDFQVEFADVIGELDLLDPPNGGDGVTTGLLEKTVVKVVVKVTRLVQITVPTAPDQCPGIIAPWSKPV